MNDHNYSGNYTGFVIRKIKLIKKLIIFKMVNYEIIINVPLKFLITKTFVR